MMAALAYLGAEIEDAENRRMQAYLDANERWPLQLELFEQEVCGMQPTIFPGRLAVADEGTGDYVHLDMYRTGQLQQMRITVTREALRIYAQRLLEAANRPLDGL